MENTLVLSSLTYAQRAKRLLGAEGINAAVVRSDAVRAVRGCGYGLKIRAEYADKAVDILSRNSIRVISII